MVIKSEIISKIPCRYLQESGSDTGSGEEAERRSGGSLSTHGAAGAGRGAGGSGLRRLAVQGAAEGGAGEDGAEGRGADGGLEGGRVAGNGGDDGASDFGHGDRSSTRDAADAEEGGLASGGDSSTVRGQDGSPGAGRNGAGGTGGTSARGIPTSERGDRGARSAGSGAGDGAGDAGGRTGDASGRTRNAGGGAQKTGSRGADRDRGDGDGSAGLLSAPVPAEILDRVGSIRVSAGLVRAVVDTPGKVGGSAEAAGIIGRAVELASLGKHVGNAGSAAIREPLGEVLGSHGGGASEGENDGSEGLHFVEEKED